MDRTEQIFSIMKTLSANRFEQSKALIGAYIERHGGEVAAETVSAARSAFAQAVALQGRDAKGAARYLVVSHLYSSVSAGGYSVKLDVFDRRLYADPHEIDAYLSLDWLHGFLSDDMSYFKEELVRRHITSIKGYELEQIRYRHLYRYHAAALELISEAMPVLLQLPEFNLLEADPEFEVLFGGYMDKAVVIWPKARAEGKYEVFSA
jgi:hypothetical protein